MSQKTQRLPKVKSLDSFEQAETYVRAYVEQLMKFKKAEQVMNDLKQDFNATIERFCIEHDSNSLTFESDGEARNTEIKVTKVSPKKVIWKPEILKRIIGRKRAARVIEKRYEISDFAGLVEYLKTCGVDPKQFKSFLTVSETVNEKALDNLFDLGELQDVDEADLQDCYTVELKPSYFRVSVSSDDGE